MNAPLKPLKPREPARNNWNPLSNEPDLDIGGFAATLIAIATIEFSFGAFVQLPLNSARVSVDHRQLVLLYAVWALVSLLGFWCVTNTFIKRWATIYKLNESPRWMKVFSRLFLLSPLLSVWATLYTLMFSEEGLIFRDGEKKTTIALTAFATFVVFHTAFLGTRIVRHEVAFQNGTFKLLEETSLRDSLTSHEGTSFWLPESSFYVHVYPYLSPLTKFILSLYGDFARAQVLAEQAPACESSFMQQKVPNCFFEAYRQTGLKHPYVTPAFGVIFESKYRQGVMKTTKAETPMQSFALNSIAIENLIALLEPGELVYERKNFLRPMGLLPFFGSPELPAVSFGQDTQRYVFSVRLVPMIAPQLDQLEKGFEGMKGALSPDEEKAAKDKIAELRARLKVLASDPLSVQ